jgi:hypothetical protein
MALLSCPECGGKVSSEAPACPHCGHPIKAASKTEGCGCATFILICFIAAFVGMIALIVANSTSEPLTPPPKSPPSSVSPSSAPNSSPQEVDLQGGVRFDGTDFIIQNKNIFDWTNVQIDVNSGFFGGGFEFKTPLIAAGQFFSENAMQFASSDGTRFNPFTTKPKSIEISADTPGGQRGFSEYDWP